MKLTAEATQWFDAACEGEAANHYYWSSDAWLAFEAGAAIARAGRTRPTQCRKSRGFMVKVETAGGAELTFKAAGPDLAQHTLERVK